MRRWSAAAGDSPGKAARTASGRDDDLVTDVHAMHVRAHEKTAGRIDDYVLPEVFVSGGHVAGLFVDDHKRAAHWRDAAIEGHVANGFRGMQRQVQRGDILERNLS